MAIPNRLVQVAAKIEAVEGVAETLAAVDAGFNLFDSVPVFNEEIEQHPQEPFEASLGTRVSLAGVRPGRIQFTTQMVGSGNHLTTAPAWAVLLRLCGFEQIDGLRSIAIGAITNGPFQVGETVTGGTSAATGKVAKHTKTGEAVLYFTNMTGTFASGEVLTGGKSGATATSSAASGDQGWLYKPMSEPPSGTVGLFRGGLRHRIQGARGNVTLRAATSGAPFMLGFDFLGASLGTDDTAMLTGVVYPTPVVPKFLSTALELQNFAAIADSIELNGGAVVEMRRNSRKAGGLESAALVSRSAVGRCDPEAQLVSEHDFYGKLAGNLTAPLEFTLGSAAGNKFIIQAPNVQYSGIAAGDRAGKAVFNLDLAFHKIVADDELLILCT